MRKVLSSLILIPDTRHVFFFSRTVTTMDIASGDIRIDVDPLQPLRDPPESSNTCTNRYQRQILYGR